MRMLHLFMLWTAVLGVSLGGCSLTEPDSETLLTFYVAPNTVDCIGVGPQTCLLVKQNPEDEWERFYGSIEGFAFEPGFTYTLRVARRHIPDPPADGSSYAYRLVRVLNQAPAPAVE